MLEFLIMRVLSQGDSLSHFLFILATEGLYVAFVRAKQEVLLEISK